MIEPRTGPKIVAAPGAHPDDRSRPDPVPPAPARTPRRTGAVRPACGGRGRVVDFLPAHRAVRGGQSLADTIELVEVPHGHPFVDPLPAPKRVTIPLQMHIGAPAEPTVSAGQTVSVNDVIARPPEGKLGVPIHASIAGRVVSVNGSIVIEA